MGGKTHRSTHHPLSFSTPSIHLGVYPSFPFLFVLFFSHQLKASPYMHSSTSVPRVRAQPTTPPPNGRDSYPSNNSSKQRAEEEKITGSVRSRREEDEKRQDSLPTQSINQPPTHPPIQREELTKWGSHKQAQSATEKENTHTHTKKKKKRKRRRRAQGRLPSAPPPPKKNKKRFIPTNHPPTLLSLLLSRLCISKLHSPTHPPPFYTLMPLTLHLLLRLLLLLLLLFLYTLIPMFRKPLCAATLYASARVGKLNTASTK